MNQMNEMNEVQRYISKPAAKNTLLKKIKIFILDDHPLLVKALSALLRAQKDMDIVGHEGDWAAALDAFPKLEPDVLILDISLGKSNGMEVLKSLRVRFPKLKVLILSMHQEKLYAMRAIQEGAHGYVMKETATEALVQAVRTVAAGEVYLSEKMGRRTIFSLVGHGRSTRTGSPLTDLSDRELEIFGMIGEGMTTRGIAEKLSRSIKTVETHRSHIQDKLALENSTELLQHAIHWRSSGSAREKRGAEGVTA
jgi:DNA-binding NarL/FixJ family response regulator